jgi:hypothetical protein
VALPTSQLNAQRVSCSNYCNHSATGMHSVLPQAV